MNNKEIKKSNLKVRIYIVIIISILLLILTSYAYFYVTRNQSDRNRLTGACFNTTFTDGDSISITNAVPKDNTEGLKTNPYHFTLNNTCSTKVKYYVILNVKNNSFDPKNLNISIGGGYGQKLSNFPINTLENTIDSGYTTSYLIKTATLEQGSTTENIRLWVNEEANMNDIESGSNKTFTAKIKIVSEVASEYNLATTKIMKLAEGASSSSTDVITKPAPTGSSCTNTLAYDGTSDNNLRYVGANPCNYVKFNDEDFTSGSAYYLKKVGANETTNLGAFEGGPYATEAECQTEYNRMHWTNTETECVLRSRNALSGWRIVGVMNNVDDGTGNRETRLKIVRAAELGVYSFDNRYNPSISGQKYKGRNDWTTAPIMEELNTDFLNTELNGNKYWILNNINRVFYYNKALKKAALAQIGDAKWYLGGKTTSKDLTANIYDSERGTEVWGTLEGNECIDESCPRKTEWTGKVGFLHLSDFGYAVGGTNRTTCIESTNLSSYYNTNNCIADDWVYDNTGVSFWTMNPVSNSAAYEQVLFLTGQIASATGNVHIGVVPAVYLNSNVTITGGTGSPDDPYTLG